MTDHARLADAIGPGEALRAIVDKYVASKRVEDRVRVTAADFNGTDWDGSPFSASPDWLMDRINRGYIVLSAADRDYALWKVRTRHRDVICEPGDWIICEPDGALSVLVGHKPEVTK